jgi:hypothetical protein
MTAADFELMKQVILLRGSGRPCWCASFGGINAENTWSALDEVESVLHESRRNPGHIMPSDRKAGRSAHGRNQPEDTPPPGDPVSRNLKSFAAFVVKIDWFIDS